MSNFSSVNIKHSVTIEPRLREYIEKKMYFKKINCDPSYSIEKQYQITSSDKKVIKRYLKGQTNLYDENDYKLDHEKKYFPSKEFRDSDEKINKIKNKIKIEYKAPENRGMFYEKSKNVNNYYEDLNNLSEYDFENIDDDGVNEDRRSMNANSKLSMINNRDSKFPAKNNQRSNYQYEDYKDNNSNCNFNNNLRYDINNVKFNPRSDPKMTPKYDPHVNYHDFKHYTGKNKYDSKYRVGGQPKKSSLKNKGRDHNCNLKKNNDGLDRTMDDYLLYKDNDINSYNSEYSPIREGDYDSMNNYGDFDCNYGADFTHSYTSQNTRIPIIREKTRSNNYDYDYEHEQKSDSTFDEVNKVNIPSTTLNRKKDLSTSDYRLRNFRNDIEKIKEKKNIETEMIRGMPEKTSKSYGYRNPAENYFSYIDMDEFRNSGVEPWSRGGDATRVQNKAKSKYIKR